MSILLTDPTFGAWVFHESGTSPNALPCPFEAPYMPTATTEHLLFCCKKTLDCVFLARSDHSELCRIPTMPAISSLCVSPCGRYLYELSSEADSVHTRHIASGELLYASQTGVFPRMMRLHPSGSSLLVAGGAVNEAYLLHAPDLIRENTIQTKSACFAADFWQGGLVLVCAGQGDDIQTIVYSLSPNAVRPKKLIDLPGQPGGLCVCPDGQTALLSTPDGLMKLDLTSGKLLWNLPEWPLCMQLRCRGAMALVSETLTGQVCLLAHEKPWLARILCSGDDPQACFC